MGKSKDLQVHVVEQHNDAVPPIHRAVASRLLPFSGAAMIHLDSHPDLLLPVHMQADTVFKPSELYDSLSIENWILPLVFAKHFDHIVWVKPPWACQIPVSRQRFLVGRCTESGCIRVTSKENYFLTDGLFRSVAELSDPSVMTLQVEEVFPQAWADLDPSHNAEKALSKTNTQGQCGPSWIQQIQDSVKDKSYVLDIDLDFFSTANPFRNLLEPEEEAALKRLYYYTTPTEFSDEVIASFTEEREEQLNLLEEIFTELENKRLSIKITHQQPADLGRADCFASVLNNAKEQGLAEEKIKDLRILCQTILHQTLQNLQASSNHPVSVHHPALSNPSIHSNSSYPSKSCTPENLVSPLKSSPSDCSSLQSTKMHTPTERTFQNSLNVEPPGVSLIARPSEVLLPVEPPTISQLTKPTEGPAFEESIKELSCTRHPQAQSYDISSAEPSTVEHSQSVSDVQVPSESLTFLQLHDFGCTLDETELPHHLSSQPQVAALMVEVKAMLESLPRPALVTIARSSEDGYCPKEEVDGYERDILKMLEEIFGTLNITKHYES